jgi:hypothetical protein
MAVTTMLRTVLIGFALLICTPALSETVSVRGDILHCKDPSVVAAANAANDAVRLTHKYIGTRLRTWEKAYKQLEQQFQTAPSPFFWASKKPRIMRS